MEGEPPPSSRIAALLSSRRRQRQEAIRQLEDVVARAPTQAAMGRLVMLLVTEQRAPEAADRLRMLATERPDHAYASRMLAAVLRGLGRSAEALSVLTAAMARHDANGVDWYLLSDLRRFGPADVEAMEALALRPMPQDDHAALLFALAKAYVDQNEPERGFEILQRANRLQRSLMPYDEIRTLRVFSLAREPFTPSFIRDNAAVGHPSPRPVFVLGMPRSGTSLVEQILASHPAVTGTGESGRVTDVMAVVAPPQGVDTLSPERLRAIGDGYIFEIAGMPGERVVDKTLENVFFAGILHLALPRARFVWVRRDPVDTCLSCYAHQFPRGIEYANDLAELGRYHRAYETTMRHWQRVLPAGTLLEIRYEDVVADLDREARRLVTHCGLAWDDACLSFHRTERQIFTASASQVRRPIYRTSVGRWRPSEQVLRPLLDALAR